MRLERIHTGEYYMIANLIEDEDVKELLSVASYCLGYMASGRHKTTQQICEQLRQIVDQCGNVMNQMEDE